MSEPVVTVDEPDPDLPRLSKGILWAAGIFTFLWVGAAILIVLSFHSTTAEPKSFNEWGDFIGGTSAPIAFIWLVVAVILQSTELREQRKELALTRQEFQHNRAVMIAQAHEARRQAEFIEQQTVILANNHEMAEAEETYNASVEFVATRLIQYSDGWEMYALRPDGTQDLSIGTQFNVSSTAYTGQTQQMIIARTVQTIRVQIREFVEYHGDGLLKAVYPVDFRRMADAVIESSEAIERLPERFKIKAKTLDLDELKGHVEFIGSRMRGTYFSALAQ